jgi:NAD(P)-dependent dehydrogenase (short-subunit alcohol dehydrogenase family)
MTNLRDPRKAGPKPPFPAQQLERPELESEMSPRPDYGEDAYKGSDRLTDRVALITGGDSGIGRAVALAFAREGADVAVSYLEADDDARETVEIVEREGRRATPLRGDVADETWCNELVERTVSELGRLDILVSNAATQTVHESVTEIPSHEIEMVMRTNLLSQFWLVRAAIPHLKPGATIITTTSIQAFDPSPTLIHYATTKGALVTFTKALAQELIEKGIRVNAVAPGPVWTPLIPMSFPAEETAEFGADNPMGRPAQPAELAPAYVFLASDESQFVVGEVIGVTGGKLTPS